MSLDASWRTHAPDDIRAGKRMSIRTPDDVDTLVAELAEPNAAQASIDTVPEPQPYTHLFAGVFDGYGYLAFINEDGYFLPIGDPSSPARGENGEFAAGSGITVEALRAAVKEYLATGDRPAGVEWRPAPP